MWKWYDMFGLDISLSLKWWRWGYNKKWLSLKKEIAFTGNKNIYNQGTPTFNLVVNKTHKVYERIEKEWISDILLPKNIVAGT